MTRLVALIVSELRQRRLFLGGSALLGLLALAAPLLSSLTVGDPGEVRAATALVLLAVWTPLLALLGGAALAGELADRRIGFYLARPLATWTIWAGKLGAAVLLPFLAGALVVLPAALAGGLPTLAGWSDGPLALDRLPVRILVLVALMHAAAIALRSHSVWLLLDLGALASGAALVIEAVRILGQASVPEAATAGTSALRVVTLTALLAAGAVAVHRGRSELPAAHRALSLTLWPPVLAGALGFLLFARWVVGAPIDSLKSLDVAWTPRGGSWMVVGGEAAHRYDYSPLFLFETQSGRSVGIGRLYAVDLQLAADGSRAIWLARATDGGPIWTLDLARAGARPRETGIDLSQEPEWLELSPRGRRLAAIERGRVLVFGIADGRLLASVRLDTPARQRRLQFLDDDRLRLVEERPAAAGPRQIEVRDLALPEGHFVAGGRIEAPRELAGMQLSPAGDRLLVRLQHSEEDGGEPGLLYALPSAKLLTVLPRVDAMSASFLADGRIALRQRMPGGRALRLFTRDGREERTFRFRGARGLQLGGQPSAGALVVAATATRSAPMPQGWTGYRLDLGSGRITPLGRGLFPASHPGNVAPAARLFRTPDALLIEMGEDGTRRVVLPARD